MPHIVWIAIGLWLLASQPGSSHAGPAANKFGSAQREPRHPHRLHLVSRLGNRLTPGAQANARETGKLLGLTRGKGGVYASTGTGLLVTTPDPDGRALIMTNHQVIDSVAGRSPN